MLCDTKILLAFLVDEGILSFDVAERMAKRAERIGNYDIQVINKMSVEQVHELLYAKPPAPTNTPVSVASNLWVPQ